MALLGATGQLGHDVARVAVSKGLNIVPIGHDEVEVTNSENLTRLLAQIQPSIVINCAAFHQVDRCEDDPAQALQVNALGALNVAKSAEALGAKCVYISTDYVFSGKKPPSQDGSTIDANSYQEIDTPAPVNVYGASKLTGEHLTAAVQPDALIIRVASLFGIAGARGKGGNFIETILRKAHDGEPLHVVNDQFMTPTYTIDAADAILRLVEINAKGLVHVTNLGACTWYDFARKALEFAGLTTSIQPASCSTFPTKAKRPANSALNTSLLTKLIGRSMRPWERALQAYLNEKGHVPKA